MREKILRVYVVAMVLGLLTGVVGSFFQLAIRMVDKGLLVVMSMVSQHATASLISASLSMIMVLLAWFLVQNMAPEAAGSGIQEIEGALLHQRPMVWRRLLPVKFIGGVLAISAKLVVGREGPTIQMGGNLGAMLAEHLALKRRRSDALVAAGSAAGLAVAFNAPLAGVLFVVEEMRNTFDFNFTQFKMVAICCVMATITMQSMLGDNPALQMTISLSPSLNALGWFFLFGIVAGYVGLLFNLVLMHHLYLTDQLAKIPRIIYVAMVGALAGFFALYYPAITGGGYDIIEQCLMLSPSQGVLLALFLLRFMATMLSYTIGVPGGIFAPMLALGTLLGLVFFYGCHALCPSMELTPGMFAVAGMGALFAAIIRSPLTGIVLVVEMTQNYSLILPLMVSCLVSTTVVQLANNPPIYTQLLRRTLKHQRSHL